MTSSLLGRRLFTGAIVLLFLYLVSPMLIAVAMGAVFATLVFPIQERLELRKVPSRWASLILTLGLTGVVLIPLGLLVFLAVKTGLEQVQALKDSPLFNAPLGMGSGASGDAPPAWMDLPVIQTVTSKLMQWFPVGMEELLGSARDAIKSTGLKVAELASNGVTQIPGLIVGLFITVISIYFFLVDGRKLGQWLRRSSPFSSVQTDHLITTFQGMCRSVILATVVSGLVQSVLFTLVSLFVSQINPFLTGVFVLISSFLPLIGSAPVTFGVALYHFVSGHQTAGIVLLIAAAIVGVSDNFVRPMVLKGGGNLHPLIAFISAFGGLAILGFTGVFLGPIIAGLFIVTVQGLTQATD